MAGQNRKLEEQDHFDAIAQGESRRAINVYDQAYLDYLAEQSFAKIGQLENRQVLFYGCGVTWDTANRLRSAGSHAILIDISFESVRMLSKKILQEEADNDLAILQMDCERLGFKRKAFDIVYGRAILHHLDLHKAAREISFVLKSGGRAVFEESLGVNPFIKLFRKLTPNWRTSTEHPLSFEDIKSFGRYFGKVSCVEFGLTAIVGVVLNGFLDKIGITPRSFKWLINLDIFLLRRFPWLRNLCWSILIVLEA